MYVTGLEPWKENILAVMQENRSSGFLTGCDINQPFGSQEKAISLKFWIYEEEELYYLHRENEGKADDQQLCSQCTADLHLCFCSCRNLVFY